MNQITVTGNVGQDPKLTYTSSGMAICKFSVGDTTGKDDKKKTVWHDITVFNEQAENVAAAVTVGARVIVVGRLSKDTYEAKDGTKRVSVEVIADEVGTSHRWANDRTVRNRPADDEDAF